MLLAFLLLSLLSSASVIDSIAIHIDGTDNKYCLLHYACVCGVCVSVCGILSSELSVVNYIHSPRTAPLGLCLRLRPCGWSDSQWQLHRLLLHFDGQPSEFEHIIQLDCTYLSNPSPSLFFSPILWMSTGMHTPSGTRRIVSHLKYMLQHVVRANWQDVGQQEESRSAAARGNWPTSCWRLTASIVWRWRHFHSPN